MQDTLRCPSCAAELTLPATFGDASLAMQCPRCLHVFDAPTTSSTAIAETPAHRRPSSPESDNLTSLPPTPRLRKFNAPEGGWFSVVFMLVLAVNAALISLFGYEFAQREGFLPRDLNFLLSDPVKQVAAHGAPA